MKRKINISIYSREAIENIIANGNFPKNTAVISFYDPAIKRIDENYSHVDYNGVCNIVFYSELDDLDLEVLKCKGYTYDTYFPEADDIAMFIYRAYEKGMDIICQCEYGQSRSSGCAAAILEHFYHKGISIFTNYEYYPNQVVYHKIFDALEKQKRYRKNKYYFVANTETIKSNLLKMNIDEKIISKFNPIDSNSVVDLKNQIEKCLLENNLLYHSTEKIINNFLKNGQSLYASFKVKEPKYLYDRYLCDWSIYAVYTYFQYGYEKIPVTIWFNRYRSSDGSNNAKMSPKLDSNYHIMFDDRQIKSFEFLGKLSWDSKRKMIDAIPLIITNIQY